MVGLQIFKARKSLYFVAAVMLLSVLAPIFINTRSVNAEEQVAEEGVWICHATDSASNPYNKLFVPYSSLDGDKKNDHSHHTGPAFDPEVHDQQNRGWGDIIPPVGDIHPGQNWDEYGQGVMAQDCFDGEVLGDQCEVGMGYASFVNDSAQGTTKGGGDVADNRSNPEDALGEPDVVNGTVAGFFSLGVEGMIEVGFDGYVMDVDGDDLSFHEATFGNRFSYGEETVDVYVSQDGSDWEMIGVASNHDTDGGDGVALLDFSSTGWEWIKYVRMVDSTPLDEHNNNGDGYDLDAVDATWIECEKPFHDCEVGNVLFMIGDEEVDYSTDNPADELTWAGEFGNFSIPNADPFVVGDNTASEFPWNSNHGAGYGTDFEVIFEYDGPAIPEAQLSLSWSPGKSGTENKNVYLNGEMLGDVTRVGSAASGWFNDMEVFADTFTFELQPGLHTFRFEHTSGDGTLWDFVKLDVSSCDSGNYIQGRKYLDVNLNGNFDRSERREDGNPNRLNGWDIYLFDSEWELVDMMTTGDRSTDVGRIRKGQFRFVNVDPGMYYVCEHQQEGWIQTEPMNDLYNERLHSYCHTIVLEGFNEEVEGVHFGNWQLAELAMYKFDDEDNNGNFDEEENLIPWRYVILDEEGEEVEWHPYHDDETKDDILVPDNARIPDTTQYAYLMPGTYWVCEWAAEGWIQTYPAEVGEGVVEQEISEDLAPLCHEIEVEESGEELRVLFGNHEAIGRIAGLIYEDQLGDGTQDGDDPALEGWTAWLLTRNSPYTIYDSFTTGTDGQFSFEGLPFGTYYICQDLQDGWLQTELGAAGTGLDPGALGVGDVIPDPDNTLDALVAEFCYEVVLSADNPEAIENVFGNQQQGQELGDTDEPEQQGFVLGATTGDVLAETGEPAVLAALAGVSITAVSLVLVLVVRPKEQ